MNPVDLGVGPSPAQNAALLLIVAAALAWLRWGLRAPWLWLAALLAWQAVMAGLALSGYFVRFDQPWRALPTVAASVAMAMWLARRPFAHPAQAGTGSQPSRSVPLRSGAWLTAAPPWAWVALQAFRLPLELLLYSLYTHGVIAQHLTFVGANFDIALGLSAIALALALAHRDRQYTGRAAPSAKSERWIKNALITWNLLGLGLLLNVVVLAVFSVPSPFQLFTAEPANRVVTQFPFVWLPTLLVPLALFGHVVSLRRAMGSAVRPISSVTRTS